MKLYNLIFALCLCLIYGEKVSAESEASVNAEPQKIEWVSEGGLLTGADWTPCAKVMINAITHADEEGLPLQDYADELDLIAQADLSTPEGRASANETLTQAALHYISDVKGERLNPRKIDRELYVRQVDIDEKKILAEGLSDQDCTWIANLPPQSKAYQHLKSVLAALRNTQKKGGWSKLPKGTKLEIGDQGPEVAALRTLLKDQGITLTTSATPEIFDKSLEEAVKRYQELHGLENDGVVGHQTLVALNTSVEDRIKQVIVTMERLRWMPDHLAPDHILVNIPGYYLEAVHNHHTQFRMPVITGKHYRETPVFNAPMTGLIFNPSWHVPYSIATSDKLPKLQRNPNALNGQGYHFYDQNGREVSASSINWGAYSKGNFPFRIRQNPGDGNALGRIRFTIKNNFNIYLHGTPSQHLFSKAKRSFSSGCIRVENPAKLAEFVLANDGGWSIDAIQGKAKTRRTEHLNLKDDLQVYVTYLTVFQDEDGNTRMVPDVYGQDAQVARALKL